MKITSVAGGIVIALVGLLGSVALAADDGDFFPIMAWNDTPGDAAVLKKMHDCGFNVAGFVAPKDLDAVAAVGMKAIVKDPRVSDYDWTHVDAAKAKANVESLINEVGNKPAVFGYYLHDEPSASLFDGLETVASIVREQAPGKWPYINLHGNRADPSRLGVADYDQYLDKFKTVCHPTILSYDNYSLMDDGTIRDGYWKNLEQMRTASMKAKIPFWNILLSVAHFNYHEPSAGDVRLQIYSSLVYGARGIAHFTYFAPQVGNYRLSPIDQFGKETPTWYFVQNGNLQLLKLAPTILKLHSDDVYHFGTVPEGSHGPGEKSLISNAGNALMVGDFTHEDGSRWVLVVNRDTAKSRPCHPTFRDTPKRVEMVSPYTGALIPFEGEQRWLAAGQGVLLKVEN